MTTMESAMGPALQILTGGRAPSNRWSGSLSRFFGIARRVLDGVETDVRGGRLTVPTLLFGAGNDGQVDNELRSAMTDIAECYPIELHSPFEDTESISGGLWSGHELFGSAFEDGLAKLRFAAGTLDLPLHVHEHSDRFISVLEGSGRFWWSEERWREFQGSDIRSTPVHAGDVLVFTRNLLHTFSAEHEDLLLLSYHSPEIPFDDPRQFTLPPTRWTPRDMRVH